MAETVRPNPVDMMPVRSRVSWAAIAAGAMVAVAIYFLLTLLGVAVGLEVAVRRDVDLGAGAALWSVVTLLIAMFFGGWSTSRLAVGESKLEAILYGVILWGVLFVGMFWLLGVGVRTGFGAMMGMASGAYTVVAEETPTSSSSGLVDSLAQRYNSEVGGQKFIEDLKKLGVEEDRAKNIQSMVNERLQSVRNSASTLPEEARKIASDPEVQQAAQRAVDQTRRATWYSLIGVIVSMATVILGSLIGSGDIPVPIAILGVRRTTPRP